MSSKVVCIDFDGVLAYYTEWKGEEHLGDVNASGAVLAKMLHDAGCKIVVYTCRNNRDMNKRTGVNTEAMEERIRLWLKENGLGFCELSSEHGKPWAHVYIDDRAVYFEPNKGPPEYVYKEVMDVVRFHPDKEVEGNV